MKTTKYVAVTALLSMLSFGAFAAQQVDHAPANSQKIGVVSASGATNLDQLQSELAAKAAKAGASSYEITSASGNNLMHGTAVIYK
ncbi:multiple stress resistance protein BhsA [Shimwellia blattae]|uniref:Putative secreted protein n=1 Tax=Shimwellia blattae (strain ATCC 29907 / DSM 4481 / JCM 1650 / NBRC 105725 / CDC 9005-74) TaxID=630626 RepID=I2BAY3_SHIBC|nr:YdgH/BhsA/McbA-like domain containing protein [Shimwellia blattae]AFJ47687.1 putative secreted protein [Shimwellia blattae DSM 4481 = NBRC 105725]GAB79733.1 stress resistance protein BhsA [Shimwellia blattae DSM 4481 = NBRC 105725]VDY65187.1 Multiple stress resistance protein BhsA precursor [Shimwellia blattae]VEC23838.1 Multiple stress resistance protein BhsA precursor [Shimwellia blattae]